MKAPVFRNRHRRGPVEHARPGGAEPGDQVQVCQEIASSPETMTWR
jgi:hypothetical protein